MPRVNAEFPTLTGPENTYVMGSSMGWLLSWYLVSQHGEVFGACGCLSTHVPWSEAWLQQMTGGDTTGLDETPYIVRDIQNGLELSGAGRFWFDYGTEGLDADYDGPHQLIRTWMLDQGYTEGETFVVKKYEGADHDPASWNARLKDPLRFLYGRPVTEN